MAIKLERRCVACQRLATKAEFWRVVRHDQKITVDLGDRLIEGRSAYLCKNLDCLNLARKKNKLGRSLKSQVSPDLYSQLLELQSSP